jgi:hypothetical protein
MSKTLQSALNALTDEYESHEILAAMAGVYKRVGADNVAQIVGKAAATLEEAAD